MKKIILITGILYSASLFGQKSDVPVKVIEPKGINFQNLSFEELKAKAKKERKTAFVNLYMSNCMPCKDMERNVFTDIGVADYYNPNFINASIDYNGRDGQFISEEYGSNCAPTFLFIDGNGKVVHRHTGYLEPEEFRKLAERASDPKRNMAYYEKEYPNKKNDPAFLLEYLRILDNANCAKLADFYPLFGGGGKDAITLRRDTVFSEYFASQKEEELINKANWEAIRDFMYDYRSREFRYLLKNAAAFKKLYTEKAVNEKIRNVIIIGNALFLNNKVSNETNEVAYINEIKAFNSPETEAALFWLMLNNAQTESKWEEYMRLVNEDGNTYIHTPGEKERVSKVIYENMTDKPSLQKAEQMMESAVAKAPSWLVYETYANVLLKLNKKAEAKTMALKALESAKQIGAKKENYNSVTYLLERIEKGN
jgi:thioredoxin-related protein